MSPELPDPAATGPADTERAGSSGSEPVDDRGADVVAVDSAGPVPADPAHHEPGPSSAGDGDGASSSPAPAVDQRPDPLLQERKRRLVILAVAAVVLIAVAVVVGFAYFRAEANGPASNQAFVDTGSTSAVEGEVTAAIKTVYSYDYRTLDANRTAATAVTTGQFAQDFGKVFDAVRQLAPKEQAVMTTAVPAAGVMELHGDRARLLMMVDQNGTKGGSQPIGGASARLVVQAQRVDGHWKIAEVTPE